MIKQVNKKANRQKRHARIRKTLSGTPDTPRLTVYKSNSNIYAQLVDDISSKTLISASTLDTELKDERANKDGARKVGQLLAKRATEKGIKDVVFDRSGYKYHGKIQELADGAREAGLNF